MTIIKLCRLKKEDYYEEDDDDDEKPWFFAIPVLAFSVEWRVWLFALDTRVLS